MARIASCWASGKSTTLYAAISTINHSDINIITAEDPVEFNIPGIKHSALAQRLGGRLRLQLRSRFAWSLSNLAALLRMNLFTHRDVWTWLDHPFEGPPTVLTTSQGVLALG